MNAAFCLYTFLLRYAAVTTTPPVVYVSPAARLSGDTLALLRSECGIEHVVVAPALEGPLTQVEARMVS